MINVSEEFIREINNDNRRFNYYVDATLTDGTVLNFTNGDILAGGIIIEDSVSYDSKLDIGSAIINQCTILLNNMDDSLTGYDFSKAKINVDIGLNVGGTEERIHKGKYIVDEVNYDSYSFRLVCLDYMSLFTKDYSESALTYPATIAEAVMDACNVCGVEYGSLTFPNSTFVLDARPTGENLTFRDILSACAQLCCCNARISNIGKLEFVWYDTDTLVSLSEREIRSIGQDINLATESDSLLLTESGNEILLDTVPYTAINLFAALYSVTTAMDDTIITGVEVTARDSEETSALSIFKSGESGYTVSVENNPFVTAENGQWIADWLGIRLIGVRYRKANWSSIGNPAIEAGDIGAIFDSRDRLYRVLVSSTTFTAGEKQSSYSAGATPARNLVERFSQLTQNYILANQALEPKLNAIDRKIATSAGLYTTEEVQPDGSTIFYLHDQSSLSASKIVWKMTAEAWGVSTDGGITYNAGMTVDGDTIVRILQATGINADWIKAGTLKLGGYNNQNGQMYVYDEEGQERVRLDNSGIKANSVTATDYFRLSSNKFSSIKIPWSERLNGYCKIDGYGFTAADAFSTFKIDGLLGCQIYDTDNFNGQRIGINESRITMIDSVYTHNQANYSPLGITMYDLSEDGDLTISSVYGNYATIKGSLTVEGTKNRKVVTKDYGERLLYCLETPSPMFEDIGEGKVADDGKCYIPIDPTFLETINTSQYQVFLQAYGEGTLFVSERHPSYFVVEGTPDVAFGWRIVAKQNDYSQYRLEKDFREETVPTENYGHLAKKYITELSKERTKANEDAD